MKGADNKTKKTIVLTEREMEKYSRQTILLIIGLEGQQRLKKARVAIIGIGALGTYTAEMLARAGVGTIILIDDDIVESSNLQRQALFSEFDIGKKKVCQAQEKLRKINSMINIEVIEKSMDKKTVSMLKGKNVDLILDCTDNVETRFLLNKFCHDEKVPWIYASAVQTQGYVMPIFPSGPCLSCFLGDKDGESACAAGIVNTLPAMISSVQTTLALKILMGKGVEQILYYVDVWQGEIKKITVKKKKNCSVCGSV
ncbi:MAG TPA: HesA/MoeB/ThiF family protein [Candidatus Nanoarchaeia archaeon]|nr:HesA/MoeB/ThiF family protein [Candidatus Nanoarchaeia archaeon]